MRMLINDEEDDEDDGDDDGDDGDDGDDDDDDDGGDDDGDDDDEEEDDEDEDEEGEDEDDHEDDDPLPAGNLVSGGIGGDQGGIELGPAREGGSNWKVSGFPMVLLPAYSLLKQEQLQLAQLALVTIEGKKT